MTATEKKLLTVRDLIARYGFSRSTIFAELSSGRLKSSYVFGRRYIRVEDADAWCDARLAEGANQRRGSVS